MEQKNNINNNQDYLINKTKSFVSKNLEQFSYFEDDFNKTNSKDLLTKGTPIDINVVGKSGLNQLNLGLFEDYLRDKKSPSDIYLFERIFFSSLNFQQKIYALSKAITPLSSLPTCCYDSDSKRDLENEFSDMLEDFYSNAFDNDFDLTDKDFQEKYPLLLFNLVNDKIRKINYIKSKNINFNFINEIQSVDANGEVKKKKEKTGSNSRIIYVESDENSLSPIKKEKANYLIEQAYRDKVKEYKEKAIEKNFKKLIETVPNMIKNKKDYISLLCFLYPSCLNNTITPQEFFNNLQLLIEMKNKQLNVILNNTTTENIFSRDDVFVLQQETTGGSGKSFNLKGESNFINLLLPNSANTVSVDTLNSKFLKKEILEGKFIYSTEFNNISSKKNIEALNRIKILGRMEEMCIEEKFKEPIYRTFSGLCMFASNDLKINKTDTTIKILKCGYLNLRDAIKTNTDIKEMLFDEQKDKNILNYLYYLSIVNAPKNKEEVKEYIDFIQEKKEKINLECRIDTKQLEIDEIENSKIQEILNALDTCFKILGIQINQKPIGSFQDLIDYIMENKFDLTDTQNNINKILYHIFQYEITFTNNDISSDVVLVNLPLNKIISEKKRKKLLNYKFKKNEFNLFINSISNDIESSINRNSYHKKVFGIVDVFNYFLSILKLTGQRLSVYNILEKMVFKIIVEKISNADNEKYIPKHVLDISYYLQKLDIETPIFTKYNSFKQKIEKFYYDNNIDLKSILKKEKKSITIFNQAIYDKYLNSCDLFLKEVYNCKPNELLKYFNLEDLQNRNFYTRLKNLYKDCSTNEKYPELFKTFIDFIEDLEFKRTIDEKQFSTNDNQQGSYHDFFCSLVSRYYEQKHYKDRKIKKIMADFYEEYRSKHQSTLTRKTFDELFDYVKDFIDKEKNTKIKRTKKENKAQTETTIQQEDNTDMKNTDIDNILFGETLNDSEDLSTDFIKIDTTKKSLTDEEKKMNEDYLKDTDNLIMCIDSQANDNCKKMFSIALNNPTIDNVYHVDLNLINSNPNLQNIKDNNVNSLGRGVYSLYDTTCIQDLQPHSECEYTLVSDVLDAKIGRGGSGLSNIIAPRYFLYEFDIIPLKEQVEQFMPKLKELKQISHIVYSGKKSLHFFYELPNDLYIAYKQLENDNKKNDFYKFYWQQTAKELGILSFCDPQVAELKRLCRRPNVIRHDTNRQQTLLYWRLTK